MDWLEARVKLRTEDVDAAEEALVCAGIVEYAVKDTRDLEMLSPYCDYIEDELLKEQGAEISLYQPCTAQGRDNIELARTALAGLGDITISDVSEEDWANNWKKYFHPIPIGDRLLIKPSWEDANGMEGRTILEIDPSNSFGTGSHATTRLCLETVEREVFDGARVLDMGCGSGILGIGALLLGAGSVVAMDTDEYAIITAQQNAERNGVAGANYKTICGNVLEDESILPEGEYDIILANIISNIIIAMLPLFVRILKKGGVIAMSGIVEERADEVLEKVRESGLAVKEVRIENEWAAIIGTNL